MPTHIIRGTVTFPYTAEVTTTDPDNFDLADYYGIARSTVARLAIDEDGLISDDAVVMVDEFHGDYTIDAVEVI